MIKKKKLIVICWFCGNKMHGSCKPVELTVDGYPRKLHKSCVREVKGDKDFAWVSSTEVVVGGYDNEYDY